MKEIEQEHPFGCAVACAAFILGKKYKKALTLFPEGAEKAEKVGFSCRELVEALASAGLEYKYKHINQIPPRARIYDSGTILFLRKSDKYPNGHYLCRTRWDKWMDPWINYPEEDRKAGSRSELPGEPQYVIFPV